MKQLQSVIALLTLTASTHAGVLVYKGTASLKKSTTATYPPVQTVFLVVDPDHSLASTILLYRIGADRFIISGPPADIRYTTAGVAQGKSVSLLSFASATQIDNDTFDHTISYFRGTNGTLKIGTTGVGTMINFPKLFGGGAISIGATNGVGRFLDLKVASTFQRNRTITANNGGLTALEVVNSIAAEYEAKGYQVP